MEGAHSHEGHAWASAGTWGGDGLYESTPGKWRLGVDSGTLGAVPVALWKDDLQAMKLLEKRKLGKVVVARKRGGGQDAGAAQVQLQGRRPGLANGCHLNGCRCCLFVCEPIRLT